MPPCSPQAASSFSHCPFFPPPPHIKENIGLGSEDRELKLRLEHKIRIAPPRLLWPPGLGHLQPAKLGTESQEDAALPEVPTPPPQGGSSVGQAARWCLPKENTRDSRRRGRTKKQGILSPFCGEGQIQVKKTLTRATVCKKAFH